MITSESWRFERIRWTIYILLALSFMLVFFQRIAPAVVAGDLMRSFNTTAAALGSLAAMYYYIYTAMQVPAGILADTLGAKISVTIGNTVAGIGSIIFGLATDFETAMIGRFLVGLGVSVIFVGLMKSNTLWFSGRYYGMISGLTVLLGNIGAILAAKPLAMLLEEFSWRNIFVGIGIFSLILAFLAIIFVKNKPEDVGFSSLQTTPPKKDNKFNLLDGLKTVLKTRNLWALFGLNLGLVGSFFAFIGLWAVPLLRDSCSIERNDASQYTTLGLLVFAITAFVIGGISDRLGKRKILLIFGISIYAVALLSFYFMAWEKGTLLFVMFGLFGLGAGCFVLTYPLAKEAVEPALSGMALSLVNMGIFLGAAIMQPLFGVVLDLFWQGVLHHDMRIYPDIAYRSALYLMLGCATLSLLSVWQSRESPN
jgi:MFS family permease